MSENAYVTNSSANPVAAHPYEPPRFEVIALDCEISAYAPDDGDGPPLF